MRNLSRTTSNSRQCRNSDLKNIYKCISNLIHSFIFITNAIFSYMIARNPNSFILIFLHVHLLGHENVMNITRLAALFMCLLTGVHWPASSIDSSLFNFLYYNKLLNLHFLKYHARIRLGDKHCILNCYLWQQIPIRMLLCLTAANPI